MDILTPSRPLSKSTFSTTLVALLEEDGQRIGELLARYSQPQGLDLHVIAQHELLGVGMEVDLLMHPAGNPMLLQVIPSHKAGPKRGTQMSDELTMTTRIRIEQRSLMPLMA